LVRVSQAKVSRLLSLARKRGIVRITVADYDPRQRLLEKELIQKLGLKSAIVIKAMDDLPIEKTRILLAHFVAPLVEFLVPPGSVVAIGGGPALQTLVRQLPLTSNAPMVVQALGRMGEQVTPADALELGRSVAEKWKGEFMPLNAPVHLPNKAAYNALLKVEQIQTARQKLKEAGVALVEVRTMQNSLLADLLGKAEVDQLRTTQAIGEICGRYFDATGNECHTPLREQTNGIEFETLRNIPQVIGVVIGPETAPAALSSIHGGLIKSLIVDEPTAKAILDLSTTEISEKKATLHYHLG
jgi:DNA-binding transcriptional regulator LsrR (DeoR family)